MQSDGFSRFLDKERTRHVSISRPAYQNLGPSTANRSVFSMLESQKESEVSHIWEISPSVRCLGEDVAAPIEGLPKSADHEPYE